ncbi:MAG: hypothetical protein AAGD35_16940 [Actinomycetota bacterium]
MTRYLRAAAAAVLLVALLPLGGSVATAQTTPTETEYFASDADSADLFGRSVAVDGMTAVVGAPGSSVSTKPGKAYVFTYDGTTWTEQAILEAAVPVASERFGYDVAIEGGTIVIGARNPGGVGAAYVFTGSGSSWTQTDRFDTGDIDDQYGTSVDIEGNRIAVGAPLDDEFGLNRGAAFVYENSGGWSQTQKVANPTPGANGLFGDAVMLDATRLFVGSPIESVGGLAIAGSAYVFDAATGAALQTIEPTDRQAFHAFGTSFSLDNGVLAIGANGDQGPAGFDPACTSGGTVCNPGSVYLYDDDPGGFVFTAELHATDLGTAGNAFPGAQFGLETDLIGDTLIVGAPNNDGINDNQGKAHVFKLVGGVWTPDVVLAASDASQGDNGGAVAIHSGGTGFLFGVPLDDDADPLAGSNEGSFYDFGVAPPTPTCNGLEATIVGTAGDDVIEGTSAADVIVTLDGDDIVVSGAGADVICLGDGDDTAVTGRGVDTVFGEAGNDTIIGNAGNDVLSGGDGDDVIFGRDDRDTINGDAGDDILRGGRGRDTIDGGPDTDTCVGGPGNDTETNCE